jgi:restriction system protein
LKYKTINLTIPKYNEIMLPLLQYIKDQKEHSLSDVKEHIYKLFKVTAEEKRELLPSGRQSIIDNRIGWARTYLKKAGLLKYTRRGFFRITDRGLSVLNENPSEINREYLMRFSEFVDFQTVKEKNTIDNQTKIVDTLDPVEILENAYQKINNELANEVLIFVKKASPKFFESLVVNLLVKMGYGGSLKDAGEAIGQAGDEGIDGIIKEDRLGLDFVYIQAKRWEGTVSRPEIQKFVGALQGRRANKGVFITTSDFSDSAKNYVKNIATKVVLVNGELLAKLMVEHDIGVTETSAYKIKKMDYDFFAED